MALLLNFSDPASSIPEATSDVHENSHETRLATSSQETHRKIYRTPAAPEAVIDASQAMLLRLEQSVTLIGGEADQIRREELLLAEINSITIEETPSALAALQGAAPTEIAEDLSARLLRRWAENDLHAAALWSTQLPPGPAREQALADVAIEFANQEPSEAADWARQLQDEAEKLQALDVVAHEFVRSNPIDAIRLAAEFPPSAPRDELICHAAMEWASQDAPGTVDWANQIEDQGLREDVLASVATAWADRDPVSAATLAVDELSPGRTQNDAVVSIVQRWVQQQPEEAAAWVEQFPAGELRLAAIENVVRIWSEQDPVQAEQWQNRMRSL